MQVIQNYNFIGHRTFEQWFLMSQILFSSVILNSGIFRIFLFDTYSVGFSNVFFIINSNSMTSFSKEISPLKLILGLLLLVQLLAACPQNCLDCDPSGSTCFACSQDHEISVFGTCIKPKVANCVLYGPEDSCFACRPSFKVQQGKCVKDFTGCINVNYNDGSCFECGFGRTIQSGKCVNVFNCALPAQTCSNCLPGYELKDNICRTTQANCETVRSDTGVCGKCKPGFSLEGFQCIEDSKILKNCYVTFKGGICAYCRRGFSFYGGQCRLPKQIEAMINGIQQTVVIPQTTQTTQTSTSQTTQSSSSATFSSGGSFSSGTQQSSQQNNNGFFSEGSSQNDFNSQGSPSPSGQSIITKQSVSFNSGGSSSSSSTPPAPILNCQVLDSNNPGKCLICVYGWYPSANSCLKVSSLCDGHNVENGNCFACKFDLRNLNGKCIDENCQQTLPSTGLCQKCNSGFQLDTNSVCSFKDPNCLQKIGQSRCAECKAGFYVNAVGKCNQLPFGCKFANMIDGFCLQCKVGFKFKQLGVCQEQVKIVNCQVVNPKDRTRCQICVYGFFPSGTQCKPVSKLCSTHDVTNGNCLACKDGLILNQNDKKCYDPYCKNQQGDTCIQCRSKYQLKQTNDLLLCQLNQPNCITIADRKCVKCASGFHINIESTCSQLRPNCINANPDGFCTQCSPNYQPISGNCQVIPPPPPPPPPANIRQQTGSQNNSLIGVNIDPNCLKYQKNVCVKCSNNFFKNNQGKCEATSVFCKGSDQRGRCLDCYPGYSLNQEGKCLISTPTDVNCRKMGLNGRCQECYQSFFVDRVTGICKRVNVFCKSSNANGECTDCYPGYQLSAGSCKIFFKDANCKKFEQDVCAQCSDRFYVNSQGKCTPVNNLCKEYNMKNGQCTVCYQGYGLQNGQCIAGLIAADVDANCKKMENGVCVECYKGFFINRKDINKCKQISKLCKSADFNTGDCTDCYPGYGLSNGQCVNDRQLRQKDPNCKRPSQFNPNLCEQCYVGFIVSQTGICSVLDPICKKHNSSNGKCTDCYPGYSLTNDGRCVEGAISSSNADAAKDPYCKKFVNGACIECSNGYFIPNTGKPNEMCKQLNPLCKQSDLNNGKCTDCYSGYVLADGSCIIAQQIIVPYCEIPAGNGRCQECITGYYPKNGACTPVSILCGDYDKQSGKCLNCIAGYIFQRGECIYPALGVDANCIEYEGPYCSKCSIGSYLSNFFCTAIDSKCIDFNYNTKNCMLCAHGLTASGANCI